MRLVYNAWPAKVMIALAKKTRAEQLNPNYTLENFPRPNNFSRDKEEMKRPGEKGIKAGMGRFFCLGDFIHLAVIYELKFKCYKGD